MKNDDIPEEFIQEIKATFDLFDKDQSGTIDLDELGDVFRSLGQNYSDHELQEMIELMDDDRSGEIEFGEFLMLMRQQVKDMDIEEEMVEAFKVFDLDGDGKIGFKELKSVLKQIGDDCSDDYVLELIQLGSTNSDESLTYDDFIRMMREPKMQ